ncbi:RNA polymerase sigma factor [Pseudobacter ginsenosidimutans]|uniref:RNA polymerase sigma factor n=1 Tax=Pseudobacter ginsenosidimutans TaxID=661488 RepID=UPI001CEF6B7C|nr:sigma-70 family RNA polymerase sigma factor [Pseudobacter ginsenosidimutans]
MNQDQYAHITDQELLGKYYAERNNYWLGLLLQRYTMLLFGVCMKYLKNEEEARDGVQQVFLKVIQELPKYKVDYFKSWLYMVAKNYCLMKLRSKNGKTTEIKETMVATPAEDSSMQNHLEKDRQLELMSESLDELSKEQKLCVTLFYLDKKSYQEIAGQTGFSMMQVKSYIQNGKRNLKINMEKKLKH